MKNFLWTGNIEKRKLVTAAWEKTCLPEKEGGLGVRSLEYTNAAFLKKLVWRVLSEDSLMADFMRKKCVKGSRQIKTGPVTFSIWPYVRDHYCALLEESI
ncbi:hypothetical protein TIFTF001_027513 [Ficus carica]|uniref:Uncharacterized protein n=1 Tax=Ficus carica TaxID=3494 RepID=A0AA88IV92_FICCA|nr:hypothetical protein TIFTF001_027513 [Ficus carica]